MAYIGNTPADKFLTLAKQSFSTSATTSYTLDSSVSSTQDIALFINNVRQSPVDAYTVSGTSLTLTSATAGTDEMYCVYLGKTVGTVSPASNSVTNDMLAGSIANSKLANSSITLNGSAVSLGGSATISSDAGTESFLLTGGGSNQTISGAHSWTHVTCLNTEKFDVGNNCSSDTFTAPTTGKYLFCATVSLGNCSGSYLKMRIATSNHNHEFHGNGTQGNEGGGTGELTRTLSIVTDMDSSDTAKIEVYSDVTSVNVLASDNTYFSGCRIA